MTINRKIKRFCNRFDYLTTYNSPFKPLKLKWYFGKIAIGTPYFFPRIWKDDKNKPGFLTAVPKKIGFDFVRLGWKTKWDEYRFEWSPIWSFVFFKWQIALTFVAPETDHYWECWLYYTRETDKTKSIKDRIEEAKRQNPCIWITSKNGIEEKICYWDVILKNKYVN